MTQDADASHGLVDQRDPSSSTVGIAIYDQDGNAVVPKEKEDE